MRSQLRMHTAIALAIILCAAIASTAATSAAVPAAGLSVTVAAVDWAHLNATTLNAINATEFLSVSAAQLASIPADACAGFTSSQLASTGATTATGQSRADGEPIEREVAMQSARAGKWRTRMYAWKLGATIRPVSCEVRQMAAADV